MGSRATEATISGGPEDVVVAGAPIRPSAATTCNDYPRFDKRTGVWRDAAGRAAEAPAATCNANPKDAHGLAKPGIACIPPVALLEEGVVMRLGADKYGPFNWNDHPVLASVYYDAMFRHMASWYAGEEIDPESGASHLAHARACAGILIDASHRGNLIDDRPKTTSAAETVKRLTKPLRS